MRKFLAMVAMLAMVCCLSGCSIIVPLAFLNGYTDGSEIETEEESMFREPQTSPVISETTTEDVTEKGTTEAVTEETAPAHPLSNPNADAKTQRIYDYICENFGTNMTKMSKKAAPETGRGLMSVIF